MTADYTTRKSRKHGVIKVCSIEYITIEIELLLPTFKSWTVHIIIEYLTLDYRLALKYLSQYNSLLFLSHPVYLTGSLVDL